MKKLLLSVLAAGAVLFMGCSREPVTIITGGKTGNYYKAAVELNEVLKKGPYKLVIKESPGSYQNIQELGAGKADLALAQYDVIILFALYLGDQEKKLVNSCHAVAPMNYEDVHIIVNKKSGITGLEGLIGKKVAVGPKHSGSWISAYIIMKSILNYGIMENENILQMGTEEALKKLTSGEIDAMFFTSMQGVPALKNLPASAADKIQLLSLGAEFTVPEQVRAFYSLHRIPAATYPWQKEDAHTLATPSYLLAYRDYPAKKMEKIAGLIYENTAELQKKSGIWSLLGKERAKQEIQSKTPYHEGVQNYLR